MLLISLSWAAASVPVAGQVMILDDSGHVLLNQALSSESLAIDLQFSNVSAAPAASIDVDVVPPATAAPGGTTTAHYVLRVQPTASWPFENDAVSRGHKHTSGNGCGAPGMVSDYPNAPLPPPPRFRSGSPAPPSAGPALSARSRFRPRPRPGFRGVARPVVPPGPAVAPGVGSLPVGGIFVDPAGPQYVNPGTRGRRGRGPESASTPRRPGRPPFSLV